MKKIHPYSIFHLDHEYLIALERKVGSGLGADDEVRAVEEYTSLMSNKPRHDPGIRDYFGSRTRTFNESVDEVKRDVDKINAMKLARKVASAKELMTRGFFIKVAEVDSDTAQDAVNFTTSVNHRWMLVHGKKVVPDDRAWRSTDSYDVIKRFDELFLKMPLGFVDMQEGNYARDLV